MEGNPFSKINSARERSDERKLEASKNPGTLNPKGLGGPIFDRLKNSFDTLGTNEKDDEQVKSVRGLFEHKLKRRGLQIYNDYLVEKKGSPTHAKFEHDVKESFIHGFDMYLKVALRLDEKDAPSPHPAYRLMQYGKGYSYINDENDKDYYLSQYLKKGSEVTADLTRHHKYNPPENIEGYATKYQPLSGNAEEDTINSYMFEKLRLYTSEFFDMLEVSLRHGINYKNAVELAEYVYGNNAKIYEEMKESGLGSDVVAWQSRVNRARVRVPLEKYIEVGPTLEQRYPYKPGFGSWVTSPKMIRNLTFKHPYTIEDGLAIADRELVRLKKEYPHFPQRLLVDRCVASPDEYEKEIKRLMEEGEIEAKKHPMSVEYGADEETNKTVFDYYKVMGPFMLLLDRVGLKSRDREVAYTLDSFKKSLSLAKVEDIGLNYTVRRRMLRSLLSYKASSEKVLHREVRIANRRLDQYHELVNKAEKKNPIWGEYFVDLGFGDTEKDILENGEALVHLVVDQFGEDDGENYLIDVLDIVYKYVDQGFSEDKKDIDALKDSLVMDPHNPKKFYEDTLRRTWPKHIEVIPFNGLDD